VVSSRVFPKAFLIDEGTEVTAARSPGAAEFRSNTTLLIFCVDNIQILYIIEIRQEIKTESSMGISTVNISFKDELLEEIDQIAGQESRSRSELIREAARLYIDRKKRWERIVAFGERQAKKLKLTEEDVEAAIRTRRAGMKNA
jgi:CopG family transcriptional regulator/antitoxin EndoAI